MPLVNAKCTNCGANLEVDNTKDAAICPYCGSAYIVEKAINNYNITNNTTNNINAEVVNVYGGNSGDFVIRGGVLEKYNGASTEVIIPNSVSIIGEGAFKDCRGITKVSIPDSVTTIEENAFWGCAELSSLYLPDSVTTIGEWAFSLCEKLSSLKLPESIQKLDRHAFYNTGVSHIVIPGTLQTIEEGLFEKCVNLKEILIQNGVKRIERRAFNGTSLSSLVIPESVEEITGDALAECSMLEELTIMGNPRLNGSLNCEQLKIIHAPDEWIRKNTSSVKLLSNRCSRGVCRYCGGEFKGRFKKVCSVCNRPQKY